MAISNLSGDVDKRGKAKGTDVSVILTGVLSFVASAGFYLIVNMFQGTYFYLLFKERGWVPYVIVFTVFWSIFILAIKLFKIYNQKDAIDDMNDIMAGYEKIRFDDVDRIFEAVRAKIQSPFNRILVRRVWNGLECFRATRSMDETSNTLRYEEDIDYASMESSYSFVKVFIWAMPVLGFIGTVIGVSQAVRMFSTFIQTIEHLDEVKSALGGVTTGLAVAFDTTLLGLVAALPSMLVNTFVQKTEADFLTSVDEFVLDNVISKIDTQAAVEGPEIPGIPDLQVTLEESFKAYSKMLKETLDEWLDGFHGVTSQLMDRMEVTGERFQSFQPVALDMINAFDGFANRSYAVFSDLTRQQGNFAEHAKTIQNMVATMNEVVTNLTEERKCFMENGDRWIAKLSELADTMNKYAVPLASLDESMAGLKPSLERLAKPIQVKLSQE